MISRAVRVPRICLACRFGLITQRSAGLGFRPSPIRESLGRRLYTSDTGKLGDSKVDPFISNKDVPETNSEERSSEHESTSTTTTQPKDTTESTNSAPATEIDSESIRTSEEKPIDPAQDELNDLLDEVPTSNKKSGYALPDLPESPESSFEPQFDSFDREMDDLLNETEPGTTPSSKSYHMVSALPDLPGLPSEQQGGSVFELDELLDQGSPRTGSSTDISELPGFDDELSGSMPGLGLWPRRRFYDHLMHEESLGVSALGRPADAIIINNPNKTRLERRAAIVEDEEVALTKIDWESLKANENVEPETEEINANIEELRPDTRILRMTDIESLVKSLCSGFTINQLREYHRDCKPAPQEDEIVNYSWIEGSVPWSSINSVQVRGSDKTAIAQKIIFEKWRIEVMEHENDLGKAFVWMDPDIFPFLLYGPNNISRLLWELRRDFLVGEDEKLTLTIQKCRLNITARKSTAYGVLAYMDQCIAKMRSRTIDVTPYLPSGTSSLKTEELKELGQLTKTSIKRVKEGTKEKFRVSWLPDSDEAPAGTEDLADMVFRLMVGLNVPGTHNVLQCIPSKGEDEVGGELVQVRRQTRAMSWRDKLGQWLRVVDPTTKTGWSAEESKPLDLAASAEFPVSRGPANPDKEITTATFGHILHSEAHDSMKSLSRKRHILLPVTPHPASFSALKPDDNKTLEETTTIVMNLVPHEERRRGQSNNAQKGAKEPAVRIKIPVKADADFKKFSLPDDMIAECFVSWHINDVMLPTEAVDVRLKHERSRHLVVSDPNLQEFLQASQFNLAEGKLRTPSQATLSVPGTWLNGHRSGYDSAKYKDVLYDFRGTEIHQTVVMPWRGHTLRYSSIEAGQQGGQRQEITLQAGQPGDDSVKFWAETRESFLQLAEDMATGKCFSWLEGYQAIKSRQLEDYSYNLPEKELTDDIIVEDKFDSRGRLKSADREKKKHPRAVKDKKNMKNQKAVKDKKAGKAQKAEKTQGAPKSQASSKSQAIAESNEEPILDDIDKLLAAMDESNIDPELKVEEEVSYDKSTEEVMSLVDTPSKLNAPKDKNDEQLSTIEVAVEEKAPESKEQILGNENAAEDKAPESSDSGKVSSSASPVENATPKKSKMSATEAERERVREEIMKNIFAAEAIEAEHSPANDKKTKPSAARKAKVAARKYTVPDLDQPSKKTKKKTSKVEEDPFAAQFAARATSDNRAADPSAAPGFFDTLPSEDKPKKQKSWGSRGSSKKNSGRK